MRIRRKDEDEVTLEMSPLIDCVFLLLIFFLVTTMMKKIEKQIPIVVPDSTVAVSERAEAQRVLLAIGEDGRYYSSQTRIDDGRPDFRPIADIDAWIAEQSLKPDVNVRLYADPNVEFQTVIDMLDKLQINHLNKVDVRMRDYRESRFYVTGEDEED